MTLNQARHVTGSPSTRSTTRPRLRLKPKAPTTGYVDGAWWPRSNDIAVELPDLLAVLSVRLGPIAMVIFNVGDWANTPTEFAMDDRPIRLGASTGQPVDTIQIIGDHHKLVLLVVPPGTDSARAHDAMMAAAAPDNAATIEDLLRVMIENGS